MYSKENVSSKVCRCCGMLDMIKQGDGMKEKIKKIDYYVKAYGIGKTMSLLYEKAIHKEQKDYERWLERHKITENT